MTGGCEERYCEIGWPHLPIDAGPSGSGPFSGESLPYLIIVRLDRLDKSMDDRFQALNTRFDDVNRRLDDLNGRMTSVEGRMTSIDTRLDGKANHGLVNFWGGFVTAWTSILVGIIVAVVKLWP
jgi:hypothetical protein